MENTKSIILPGFSQTSILTPTAGLSDACLVDVTTMVYDDLVSGINSYISVPLIVLTG